MAPVMFHHRQPPVSKRNKIVDPEKLSEHFQIVFLVTPESCCEVGSKLLVLVIWSTGTCENSVESFCGVCQRSVMSIVHLGLLLDIT
jgi:hypothetical protein